ncbi:MAG: hypothetical protein EOP10_08930 [Proteobacteria bacterium]|nr:MAG: hypothetical protein EOP10_08930 [Pseudomonadota bacterium]
MKILRTLLSFLTLVLLAGACNFQDLKVDETQEFGSFTDADLNYATINQRIITPYCLSCHSAAGGNRGGINLESYDSIASRLPTIRRTTITQKTMPPSSSPQLPPEAIQLLDAWITAGATD